MEIKKTNAKFKENETRLGVYVWEMPDGRWIGDDDGNFLSITSMRGNRDRINLLARAVRVMEFMKETQSFVKEADKLMMKSLSIKSKDLGGD